MLEMLIVHREQRRLDALLTVWRRSMPRKVETRHIERTRTIDNSKTMLSFVDKIPAVPVLNESKYLCFFNRGATEFRKQAINIITVICTITKLRKRTRRDKGTQSEHSKR